VSIEKRFARHSWKCTKTRSAISAAINKYGKANFTIKAIEECQTVEQLCEREEHWISNLNTVAPNGYNLKYFSQGKGHLSESTKRKIGKSNKGKKRTPEAIKTLSEAHRGFKVSAETKAKLSAINKGKAPCALAKINCVKATQKTYRLITPANKEIVVTNMRKFCQKHNLLTSSMSCLVNGKLAQHRGYKFAV
jgi:group I intron endonuclease